MYCLFILELSVRGKGGPFFVKTHNAMAMVEGADAAIAQLADTDARLG